MCGIFGYLRFDGQKISLNKRNMLFSQFVKTQHRGPEHSIFKNISNSGVLGFHRLRVIDVHHGTQPFHNEEETVYCICNGEIYNHEYLKKMYKLETKSLSDCEVIFSYYMKYGKDKLQKELINNLDGVYAFCIIDLRLDTPAVIMSRDPFGIRSLYYAEICNSQNQIKELYFTSELKSLPNTQEIHAKHFNAGYIYNIYDGISYYKSNNTCVKYISSNNYEHTDISDHMGNTHVQDNVRKYFEKAVSKRMMSNRPIGCLLSGGLDSSLTAALVAKHIAPARIHTFSIGMEGATDIKYARMVAEHINSIHHEVIITEQEMLDAIPEVIYHIESWDETTILASTPMYLLCKYIREHTDIIVVFTGEGADELFGSYMYFHNAPNLNDFQNETYRLLNELQYYDVLRCEKCISAHGLEARVPFLDLDFVDTVANLNPIYKDPKYNKRNGLTVGKYLMRQIFDDGLLPTEVLWRTKEAFSNGCSPLEKDWHKTVNEYCENMIFRKTILESGSYKPHSKKGAYFRSIYIKYFGCENIDLIPGYWVPRWSDGSKDSSARTLNIYKNLINETKETETPEK
jgi:asparagine synthase (glutamine-hydrolysing)